MSNFAGFDDVYDQSARLAILRCLSEQSDYRMTDSMINDVLDARYGFRLGRPYVRDQILWLENNAGAVKTQRAGPMVLCELVTAGVDHLMGRNHLPGVKRAGGSRD